MAIGRGMRPWLALLALGFIPLAAEAAEPSWDGTWVGVFNNSDPVSVTIAGGKVISYAIRGGQPFGIGYSRVTAKTVAFGDHQNYDVKITKASAAKATGFAHSPLGDGAATLSKQ
jgi:hypothetical protein